MQQDKTLYESMQGVCSETRDGVGRYLVPMLWARVTLTQLGFEPSKECDVGGSTHMHRNKVWCLRGQGVCSVTGGRVRLITTVPPRHSDAQLMRLQQGLCAGCQTELPADTGWGWGLRSSSAKVPILGALGFLVRLPGTFDAAVGVYSCIRHSSERRRTVLLASARLVGSSSAPRRQQACLAAGIAQSQA